VLRHEFMPGRLVVGVAALATASVYGGDLAGLWQAPWYVALPVVFDSLWLAGLAAWVGNRYRRRRSRAAQSPSTE
jgi:hypothetical protein